MYVDQGICFHKDSQLDSVLASQVHVQGARRFLVARKNAGKDRESMDVDDMFVTCFSNVFHDAHRSPQKTKRGASGRLRLCQAVLVMKDF